MFRYLFILIMLLPSFVCATETIKISELGTGTAVTNDDYLVFVDNPGGTPVTKKITFENFVLSLGLADLLTSLDLSTVTISGGTASRMAEWDGSGNLTSSDTATTGTGAPVKAVSPTLTSLPKVNITFSASNGTYSGTSLYFAQCAASMGFGQPAYIQSTGKPGLADADGVATMPAIGLVVVASTDADTPCTILTHGVITNTTWNWTTVGATIYVADGDAGALTATVGDISDTNDVVQVIGIALHADTIFVNPSLTTIVLE